MSSGDTGGLLAVPSLTPMLISSWLWHLTRWGGLFCCTYMITQDTHSTFLTQLAGVLMFTPMLLGGFAAGAMADRIDRSRLVLTTELGLVPIMVVMFVVVQWHLTTYWVVFPFTLALGIGMVVNTTGQRALIADLSGALSLRALTVESAGLSSAIMLGPLLCGAAIQVAGPGAAFGLLAGAMVLSVLLYVTIPSVPPTPPSDPPISVVAAARQSLALLGRSRLLASMLGVTVIFNVFYFSFTPLVPALAERFHIHAAMTGALGSTPGAGALIVGMGLGMRTVHRVGRLFVLGAATSLAFLGLFTLAPVPGLAFLALLLAGGGSSAFGGMQTSVALAGAGPAEGGAALGLMSMAIGAGPIGMLLLGAIAEAIGPQPAVGASAALGLLALLGWIRRWPESPTLVSLS